MPLKKKMTKEMIEIVFRKQTKSQTFVMTDELSYITLRFSTYRLPLISDF
jgi:hypothetical protein